MKALQIQTAIERRFNRKTAAGLLSRQVLRRRSSRQSVRISCGLAVPFLRDRMFPFGIVREPNFTIAGPACPSSAHIRAAEAGNDGNPSGMGVAGEDLRPMSFKT